MDQFEAVVEVMTPEARELAMNSALAINPRLRGAHLDDVLEMYDSHDGLLWFREPFWEQYGGRYDRRMRPYASAASIAVALMLGTSEEPNPLTACLVDALATLACAE